ncbi:MAG: tetratricopeptide repeat protein [Candidatus Zixiibacteriota bacterium]
MFKEVPGATGFVVDELSAKGYPAALASMHLREGRFSRAVEICREHLAQAPSLLSLRLVYARALYHAGQAEPATEQFYRVLGQDPDNVVALKYLGDIKYTSGDEFGALSNYGRIQQIDALSRVLSCPIPRGRPETTRTITLKRTEEEAAAVKTAESRRAIPFYTETVGDLFLKQGYARMALDVYRELSRSGSNPRIAEKLALAEEKIKEKESSHVKKTD